MIPINFHTIVLRRKHSRTWRGTISDQRRDAAVSSFISRQEQDPCRSFRLLAGPSRDVITTRHLSPSLVFTAFAGDFFWCPVKTRNRARQLCLLSLSLSLDRTTRIRVSFERVLESCQIYWLLLTFVLFTEIIHIFHFHPTFVSGDSSLPIIYLIS